MKLGVGEPVRRRWIGIDGVDATGKTTCVELIRAELTTLTVARVGIFDEFTFSPIGETIREIISEKRFFSLSDPPSTRLTDTSLLLADWVLKIERAAASEADIFVSDRSHLSILGYQLPRLHAQYGPESLEAVHELLLNFRSIVDRVVRGIKVTEVLLVIEPDELQRRVSARGETPLSTPHVDFLMAAQDEMVRLRPAHVIHVSGQSLNQTFAEVREILGLDILHEQG